MKPDEHGFQPLGPTIMPLPPGNGDARVLIEHVNTVVRKVFAMQSLRAVAEVATEVRGEAVTPAIRTPEQEASAIIRPGTPFLGSVEKGDVARAEIAQAIHHAVFHARREAVAAEREACVEAVRKCQFERQTDNPISLVHNIVVAIQARGVAPDQRTQTRMWTVADPADLRDSAPKPKTLFGKPVQMVDSLPGDDSDPVYRTPRPSDFAAPKPDDVDRPGPSFAHLEGVTIGDSIRDFCAATGKTVEQVKNDPAVRREWVAWMDRPRVDDVDYPADHFGDLGGQG